MKRILIIRPSSVGDIVMASAMIPVLRKALPEAFLAWLADPGLYDLLRHEPSLDAVILWPKARWRLFLRQGRILALAREIRHFSKELRSYAFDTALDGQGLFRSRMLARLSGACRRIGFDSREPGRSLMTRIVSRASGDKRMGSEYYHLMQELGFHPGAFHPQLQTSPADDCAAAQKIRNAGIEGRYAVICPFTTRPQKHWFDQRWADLIQCIERGLGLAVVILGGAGDRAHSRHIRQLTQPNLYDLTGETTLGQALAVIRNSSLIVGVDTGLTHMGAVFDRPTVALFGATCPYRFTAGNRTTVICHKQVCSPCRRRPTCGGAFTCMKSIEVDQVFKAARSLLNG